MNLKNHQFPSVLCATMLAAAIISSPAALAGTKGKDIDSDGIPNRLDRDVDGDGTSNGADRNVDGGICKRGPKKGKYVGDRLANSNPNEKDIDDDGKPDSRDDDIDGDGIRNGLDDDGDGDGRGRRSDNDDDGDEIGDDSDDDDDNDGVNDDNDDSGNSDDSGEVEVGLNASAEAPVGSRVQVKINKLLSGEIEFEVDGRGLAVGSYDIVVNGNMLGILTIKSDDGSTEGETKFETTPDDKDELPLPFDPSGLAVEIRQGVNVFFSGSVPKPLP